MKPLLSKKQQEHKQCDPASCDNCKECRVVSIEERRDPNGSATQLYSKETDNYFFYYALNVKQSS